MKAKGIFIGRDLAADGGLCLAPEDERAREIARELVNSDKKALVWVHTARYPEHHRFAFAVMQKIADAIGVPVEAVLLSLKYETGRFDYVELVDGSIKENPHSIKFESMDQAEFQKFWDDVLVVLREKWMPRMADDVFVEIQEMIAGKVDQ
jgi:hypothetical protein